MPALTVLPSILRELLVRRSLPREPEPALVMSDPEQVAAYVEAGRIDGTMAAAYLFHSARASQVLQGCRMVYDLGCGPATQLAQIAQLNPDIRFTGIDLSRSMLDRAQQHIDSLAIRNIELRQDDIATLSTVANSSADGIVSTMAFHHLPTADHLRDSFAAMRRILKPGGALYLADFGRLKSLKSVIDLAYLNASEQPHLFTLDYERSLRAAFLLEEFADLARQFFPDQARTYGMYKVPLLVLVKTKDLGLPEPVLRQIRAMRLSLAKRYRRDLDDIRRAFRLGGLGDDPF
jgi:arsenite methyltransferase